MRGTPVEITRTAKIPRRIWVENLVVLWVTMVMNIKICKDWPRCSSFQWNEFHSKYSSNGKQRWVQKWRPSKINYDEVIKWSNFRSVIVIYMLTLLINQDVFLRLITENPFKEVTPELSFHFQPDFPRSTVQVFPWWRPFQLSFSGLNFGEVQTEISVSLCCFKP